LAGATDSGSQRDRGHEEQEQSVSHRRTVQIRQISAVKLNPQVLVGPHYCCRRACFLHSHIDFGVAIGGEIHDMRAAVRLSVVVFAIAGFMLIDAPYASAQG
jgi:hypothetical protein